MTLEEFNNLNEHKIMYYNYTTQQVYFARYHGADIWDNECREAQRVVVAIAKNMISYSEEDVASIIDRYRDGDLAELHDEKWETIFTSSKEAYNGEKFAVLR